MKLIANFINQIEIHHIETARIICQLIPASCPFERRFKLLGHTVLRIPPLCKLNPLYDPLMALRFRALTYLEVNV